LYETERLVQELAKFEIDCRNIVINQVVFPNEVGTSRLLSARVKMQQKYLEQFYDLYEDFHIVKMPLLEEEVRGVQALKAFSNNLVDPYDPAASDIDSMSRQVLEMEAAQLRARLSEIESRLTNI
jgi:arsenite-transporting ATPase